MYLKANLGHFLFFLALTSNVSCKRASDFASLDSSGVSPSSEGIGRCRIKSMSPPADVKVSGNDSTITNFTVIPEGTDCEAKFYLNGSSTALSSTSMTAAIHSSDFIDGENRIRVELKGPIGNDLSEWVIQKNTMPTCSLVSPEFPNINVTDGTQQTLMVSAGGIDSDETLTFDWTLNGNSSNKLSKVLETGTVSQYRLNTTGLTGGSNNIGVSISDGIDTVTCAYTVNVGADCTLSGKTPDVPAIRVAAQPNSQILGATATSSNCLVSWTINNIPVTGSGLSRTVNSSELRTGSNYVAANVVSTSGNSTQSWIMNKNAVPACNQSPIGSVTLSSGSNTVLQSVFRDDDLDALSWTWSLNGGAASSPTLVVTNNADRTSGVFAPTDALLGFNSIGLAVTDGLDTTTCNWSATVNPACSISSFTPNSSSLTIPNASTSLNSFSVIPSSGSCTISWELNGVNLGSVLSLQTLLSSSFLSSTNHLKARVFNGSSTDSHEWVIEKNKLPICQTQTPSTSGSVIGVGQLQPFYIGIQDDDTGQGHTFTWKHNGSTPNVTYFSEVTNSSDSTGNFTPLVSQTGSNSLSVDVNDGFDTRTCSWSTTVLPNCSITGGSPSGSSVKVANASGTSSSFAAVANDGSCAISWTLNSSSVGSGSFYNTTSASLSSTNTLIATASNAVSSAQRSWTVTKNTPSSCSSQFPGATGSAVEIGDTLAMTGQATNPDGDSLSFQWLFASNPSSAFQSVVSTTTQSSANYVPIGSQIGLNQNVRLAINDGYDTSYCDWTMDITDPNVAQILSWSPTSNPVILLSDGTVDLSVAATGTGIEYAWYIDNVLQGTRLSSTETFTNSELAVGLHSIKVVVTDDYNGTDQHTFTVKRNARPSISAYSPAESGVSKYRVNVGGSLAFSTTASDANGDTLTYEWTLNNNSSDKINDYSSSNHATFSPNNSISYIGSHVLRVRVSDGSESVTQAWNVDVNYFSDECNIIFNGSSSGLQGGRVCTLVGNPSIGDDQDVIADPTLFKGSPNHVITLEPNVYAFTDNINHTVGVVNNSGSSVTFFNKTIPNGKMKVVMGMGQRGLNNDLSALTDVFNNSTGQPSVKLWQPLMLAFDSDTHVLYISEYQAHRVIALTPQGKAVRVLGLTARTTATTTATADGAGYSVSCSNPFGLDLNTEGSNKYLYVACQGHNVIKKVDVTAFTGSNSPTFQTTTVIGRYTNSGTAVYASGSLNGKAGSTNSPTNGGVARLDGPSGLFAYGGLIYFSDRYRVRVYNPTANAREFYPDYASNQSRFQSNLTRNNFQIYAQTLENSGLTLQTAHAAQVKVIGTGTVSSYDVIVANETTKTVGACHLGIVLPKNAGGTQIAVGSSTPVTVTKGQAGNWIYTTPDCSDTGANSKNITIGANQTAGYFWFKPDAAGGTHTVSAGGSTPVNIAAAAPTAFATAYTHISYSAQRAFTSSDCAAFEIKIATSTSSTTVATTPTSNLNVIPGTNNFGTFYKDAACSQTFSGDDRLSFSSGTPAIKTIFYSRRVYVPSNYVTTLFGYTHNTGTAYSDMTTSRDGLTVTGIGAVYYNNNANASLPIYPVGNVTYNSNIYPQGIAYVPPVSGSSWGSHNINLANLWGTNMNIPTQVRDYSSRMIAGWADTDNYFSGYNGDDAAALGTYFSDIFGLSYDSTNNNLIVADRGNNRLRNVELSGSGRATALLGIGRLRERTNALQIQANQASLARPFKLEIFDNKLYFSELNNNRIRRTDLTTGIVESVAGIGSGNSFNEGNDATAEFMRSPKGFKVVAWPNTLSPTNYILVYAESCQIRAANIAGPTISSFMGINNILPGKVKTIAGDTSVNCQSVSQWTPTPVNTNGMTAINARFRNVYDIAFIKNEIYFIDYDESCLMKVTSTGKLYEVTTGTCGTVASAVDGEFGTGFVSRRPIAFFPDTAFLGSYFLLDSYDLTAARLNYINSSSTDRYFVGNAVAAYATSSVSRVTKIYDVNGPSGLQARPGGVASWTQSPGSVSANDKVCWASGDVDTNVANQIHGTHAIYCALRSAGDTGTIAAGPLTGSGAGGPLDREQEGAGRFNVTFWGPTGIAFDDDGNLYVADSGNHIIRMIRRWW